MEFFRSSIGIPKNESAERSLERYNVKSELRGKKMFRFENLNDVDFGTDAMLILHVRGEVS